MAFVLAAVLTGCGGPARRAGPARPADRSALGARAPTGGRALFRYECGTCHTIGHPDSPHQGAGGDVLAIRLSRRDMLTFAREMPRIHGFRTDAQLQAIVDYLQRLEHSGVR